MARRRATVAIYFQTEGEIERFREIISADALAEINLLEGTLSPRLFVFPAANLVILSANELLGRFPIHGRRRFAAGQNDAIARKLISANSTKGILSSTLSTASEDFLGLPNAFYAGRRVGCKNASSSEVLVLEFADEAKLYVPLEQAYLVSRYVGVGKKSPPLSFAGGCEMGAREEKRDRLHF